MTPTPAERRSLFTLAKSAKEAGKSQDEVRQLVLDVAHRAGWVDDLAESTIWVEYEANLYGGSTTFDEYDAWERTASVANMADAESVVEGLFQNIMTSDAPLASKADRLQALAGDFGRRTEPQQKQSWWSRLWSVQDPPAAAVPIGIPDRGLFSATRDANGEMRWMAVYSNNFRDVDGELFPEEYHRRFIDWAERNRSYPELRLWHTPGTRLGEADWLDMSSGFMVASGTIDAGKESTAEKLSAMGSDLGVSHGYIYDVDAKRAGVYGPFWTYEISPLPREHAGNVLTGFMAGGQLITAGQEVGAMPFDANKKAFLSKLMTPSAVAELEAGLEATARAATAAGFESKETVKAPEPKPLDELVSMLEKLSDSDRAAVITRWAAKAEPEDPPPTDPEPEEPPPADPYAERFDRIEAAIDNLTKAAAVAPVRTNRDARAGWIASAQGSASEEATQIGERAGKSGDNVPEHLSAHMEMMQAARNGTQQA